MVATVHPATDLARRLEAFVIERFPFAVAPARAAFDVCKSAVRADEASLDALRAKFAQELRTRLQNIAPTDRSETTPGVEATARFQTAIEELLDACDGFDPWTPQHAQAWWLERGGSLHDRTRALGANGTATAGATLDVAER